MRACSLRPWAPRTKRFTRASSLGSRGSRVLIRFARNKPCSPPAAGRSASWTAAIASFEQSAERRGVYRVNYVFPPSNIASVAVVGSDLYFPVHRIYCVGRNYAEHAREMGVEPEREAPFFFEKPA